MMTKVLHSTASIRRRRATIDRRAAKLDICLKALQEECNHPNAKKKHRSNTGNYDSSLDCYWIDWKCPDCGRFWQETEE